MNFGKRKEVIAVLEAMRTKVCAYGGHKFCDCKYCGGKIDNLFGGTEAGNGCCELASAINILKYMKEREYEMFIKRERKANLKKVKTAEKKYKQDKISCKECPDCKRLGRIQTETNEYGPYARNFRWTCCPTCEGSGVIVPKRKAK